MAFAAIVAANHAKRELVDRDASATALYMDSFVSPHVQALATSSILSEVQRKALQSLLAPTSIGRPIVGFRIWAEDRIIFSNDPGLIGRRFPPSPARDRAWAGVVSAELDVLHGGDDVEIRALDVVILEIYSPVRQTGTGRIIALAETYEIATNLKLEVWAAQILVWIVCGAIALGTILLLFGLADFAAREMSRMHRENEEYRARVGGANRRVFEMNEQHMRRIGKDLQDGPMRMLGLALLKLDSLREQPRPSDIETVGSALNKTLRDIRSLAASLVPSKLGKLSLADTIVMAARRHERSTGMPIACRIDMLPADAPISVKACFYRFVQDGLAYCRPLCDCCTVCAIGDGDVVEVAIVCDPPIASVTSHHAIEEENIFNLRDRVEALGGTFFIQSRSSLSSITARLKLGHADLADG